MLTTAYNTDTKQVTMVTDIETWRCMGLAFAVGIGGLGLAQHILQGLVAAAENTSNDEDFQNQAGELFQHIRDEHTTTPEHKQVVDIMEKMALALPRSVVMEEHFRQLEKLGKHSGPEGSFTA